MNTNQELVGIKNDFCDALVKLSNDRALCKRLGENGYRYVNDKLTWDEKYNRIVKNM